MFRPTVAHIPLLLLFHAMAVRAIWWVDTHTDSLDRIVAMCHSTATSRARSKGLLPAWLGRTATPSTTPPASTVRLPSAASSVCSLEPAEVRLFKEGAQLVLAKGHQALRNETWDCRAADWNEFLQKEHRESAFAHALITAGVAYRITRACASGDIEHAKCNCSDDGGNRLVCELHAHHGYRRSKVVDELDMRRSSGKRKVALYLHNNWIGRTVFRKVVQSRSNQLLKCNCVGPSASCVQKACWKALPDMSDVVRALVKKLEQIAHIPYKAYSRQNITEALRTKAKYSLAYYRRSPEYCRSKPGAYYFGTEGRECSGEVCKRICCGRGTRTSIVKKDCLCKFRKLSNARLDCEVCRYPQTVCN